MAEAFGVLSGAFGVFSLSIQIASSIKTLKDFVDVVKETPAEAHHALNEVEALSLVLQDIEQSVRDQTAALPAMQPAIIKAVQLCKTSNDILEALAQELNNMAIAGKRWLSVKAALRRDRLTRFRMKLESTKTLLVLANQCYYKYALYCAMVCNLRLTAA